jgi:tetratricopeptide (TPR) repeat protein
MTSRFCRRLRTIIPLVAILLIGSLGAGAAAAQRSRRPASEFTRQGLLIVNFTPLPGARMRDGRDAANEVRSRVSKLVDRRAVEVINGGDIAYEMERAGYNPDTVFSLATVHAIGRYLRADEYVLGHVARTSGAVRLSAELVLLRDEKLRQPLPVAVAPTVDSAAHALARSLAAARAQLVPERRCENALRDGHGREAEADARDGIAAYGDAALARTCLVWALRQRGAPPKEVLGVAREILAIDSVSPHGLEAAAVSLDSLHHADEAAAMWLRLAATAPEDVDLALRVTDALFEGGNSVAAEPFIARVSDAHPDDMRLVQQAWRVAYVNKSWPRAIRAAETLLAADSSVRRDSTFYLRLATAYGADGKQYRAIETLAHGVGAFPKDVRLYSLYARSVRAEADTVVPRGLTLFPRSADLLALQAKAFRASGKLAESLSATERAVALDSSLAQGELVIADLQFQVGQPDSALFALHRGLDHGEDSTLVAQFALQKGNALYRAASGVKTSNAFGLALRFLSFSDSVHTSTESKFLIGAAALGVAQTALAEATSISDKAASCELARRGADMLPLARVGLLAGQEAYGDAAKQSIQYLDQLDPYIGRQLTVLCPAAP